MAARRKASPFKFITLTSSCGNISQAEYSSNDDTFTTPEFASEGAIGRYTDGESPAAIFIVEVVGVVKPNKPVYTPIGTQSVYDIEG